MQTQFPSNLHTIWQAIAEHIAAQVSKDTFHRWFKAIDMTVADENQITLTVPNNIYQLWIESNYIALLQASVASVLGGPRNIHFVTAVEAGPKVNGRPPEAEEDEEEEASGADGAATDAPSRLRKVGSVAEASRRPHAREEAAAASAHAAAVASGMNPRNTFSTFVVGANNQFAHAAALAVSQAPARTYNPLFIYGGVGLGKTHLMQAIGQHVAQRAASGKVMYLSSEKFTNEFIDAIQNNSLVKFRKRYRQADLLLIDDIQFFSGKERSQEEFFHTFNTLFDGHKQIVLSSDRPPAEIANLEQRLVSRFEWGLTAELQPPDIETRLAILRKKAESLTIKLESNILEFLAQRIRTNVRRLEGALMRVASYASLNEAAIGTDAIEHLLKDILHEESRRTVSIDLIQRKVAEHFDVRFADMTSKRRPQNIAFPRQIAMYLARELTKSSLAEIGEAFGGRDHGTVLHAHRLVGERMRNEEKIRQTVSFLESHLNR
jgi:chromosomal replication initiator protein